MRELTGGDARIVGNILGDVARAEVMPRFHGVVRSSVRSKTSTFDVVTDADEAAEREISARLRKHFPGAVIIGEEAAGRAPELLAHRQCRAGVSCRSH